MLSLLVSAGLLIFIAYYIVQANAKPVIPRVGKPGLIGYIFTALRFTVNAEKVLKEGWDQFSGRPFTVPTLARRLLVVLGPQHVELLGKSNDTVYNMPRAIDEMLQRDYTMNKKQLNGTYHVHVIRTDLTRAITSFISDILDETELAMQDTFDPSKDSKPVHLPVHPTLVYMVGRIANRVMLGTELCRNEEFIHAVVTFAETLFLYANVLILCPRLIRPAVHSILSSIFGGPKEPKKFIIPYLEQHMHYRKNTEETPTNIAQFLICSSGQEKVDNIATRVLNVNFASIHTTSIFLTRALFELAVLPKSDLESIRTEVTEALDMEGGWNQAAVARFRMIDSLLREVGRFHGLSLVSLERLVIRDGVLDDGTRIPAGHRVAVYLAPVHFNHEIYPNPHTFDAFRFSRLKKEGDSDVKYGFTTIDNNYLSFGIGKPLLRSLLHSTAHFFLTGRHACPGRFFAAMELKVMIAHLLVNYEISLPPGITERPKDTMFNYARLPDRKAELVFKRRAGAGRNVCLSE